MAEPFNFSWNIKPTIQNPLTPNATAVNTPANLTPTVPFKQSPLEDETTEIFNLTNSQTDTQKEENKNMQMKFNMNNKLTALKEQRNNLMAEKERLLKEKDELTKNLENHKKFMSNKLAANEARKFNPNQNSLFQWRWKEDQENRIKEREITDKRTDRNGLRSQAETIKAQIEELDDVISSRFSTEKDVDLAEKRKQRLIGQFNKVIETAKEKEYDIGFDEWTDGSNPPSGNETPNVGSNQSDDNQTPEAEKDYESWAKGLSDEVLSEWATKSIDTGNMSNEENQKIKAAQSELKNRENKAASDLDKAQTLLNKGITTGYPEGYTYVKEPHTVNGDPALTQAEAREYWDAANPKLKGKGKTVKGKNNTWHVEYTTYKEYVKKPDGTKMEKSK